MRSLNCRSTMGELLIAAAMLAGVAGAQVHGVPASVTSYGPGRGPAPGVPASVTSLGPNGFGAQPSLVPGCCVLSSPQRHHGNRLGPVWYPAVAYPYYSYDIVEAPVDDSMMRGYSGGRTVFDRNGYGGPDAEQTAPRVDIHIHTDSSTVSRKGNEVDVAPRAAEPPAPAIVQELPDPPETELVFKDGRHVSIRNYAIVGDTLYDVESGRTRKIALADLDLAATQKRNEELGVEFRLPGA